MTTHSLRLAIVPRPEDSAFSGSDYWLRMEQITGSDIAEPAEFAEIVDELYGIEACSPEPTPEEDPPPITWERLLEISKRRLDLEECRRLASGTYTARVKLIYSHPGDPNHRPKLSVTIGRIVSRQMISEEISQTLSVREQKYLDLDYPVLQEENQEWPGKAKWLGSVFNDESGAIHPPPITGSGNRLAWSIVATGTILVKYATTYELVTIEVPGIPRLGSLKGDTQDTLLRAFWRYQVYEQEITAVANDTSADGQTLAKLCGWDSYQAGEEATDEQGGNSDGDQGDDGTGQDQRPTGCLDPAPWLTSTDYYMEVCCVPPLVGLPNCALSATVRPQVPPPQPPPNQRGKVSYVPVGPGPDGCGILYTHQQVNRRNCCSEIPPLTAHPDNPESMGANDLEIFQVLDGRLDESPMTWTAGGGLTFKGGATSANGGRSMLVISPSAWCEYGRLTIDDGCTVLNIMVANESPPDPFTLTQVAGDISTKTITVQVEGGRAPYYLTTTGHTHFANGQQEITIGGPGGVLVFVEDEQLCLGEFFVRASDACTSLVELRISPNDALGMVKVCYSAATASLVDWVDDCEPAPWLSTLAGWYSFTGMGSTYRVNSTADCLPVGTFWIKQGSSSYVTKAVIHPKTRWPTYPYTEYYPIDYTPTVGAVRIPDQCGEVCR